MKLIGLVRLGRDAEVRYSPEGKPIANFSGAYNYGRKVDGQRPTQWVKLTMFGERAERLADYLKKGAQISIVAGDVHVETFEKRDGSPGWKFVAIVDDLEFASSPRESGEGHAPAPAPRPQAQRAAAPAPRQAAPKSGTGFDDLDDDIPF